MLYPELTWAPRMDKKDTPSTLWEWSSPFLLHGRPCRLERETGKMVGYHGLIPASPPEPTGWWADKFYVQHSDLFDVLCLLAGATPLTDGGNDG